MTREDLKACIAYAA
ncbi:MAG: hypothetical protein AAGL17_13555, partial [Cyanobacteria bacterium J06576_12]